MAQKSSKSKRKGVSFKNKLKLILHTLDMKSKIVVAAFLFAVVGGSVAFGVFQNTKFKSSSRAEGFEDVNSIEQQAPVESNSEDQPEIPAESPTDIQTNCKLSGPLNIAGYDPSGDVCSAANVCKDGFVLDQTTACGDKVYCCRQKGWVDAFVNISAPDGKSCLSYEIIPENKSDVINNTIAWTIYRASGQRTWVKWVTNTSKVVSAKCP